MTLVGRFKPRKGQLRLLEAHERIANRDQVQLLLAGSSNSTDGSHLTELRRRIDTPRLRDHVTVLDSCPDSIRDLAWAATDIATQPSTREGLGLAAIEAMRAGAPMVASDTDGLREVVTPSTGLLVDTADPEVYARALDELVRSPDQRDHLGANGARRAATVFSLERMVNQTLAVYEEARCVRAESGRVAAGRFTGAQR